MNAQEPLEQLNKIRQTPLLPTDRKQALRKNLLTHMALRQSQPLKVAVVWQLLNAKLFSRPVSMVLATGVLVILAGAGTAFAAKGALPGQTLYIVKTQISEPVRAALTIPDDDRAVYEIELATKRMEEAHALAAEGHLDETTQTQLTAEFENHVQEVHNRVQKLQTEHYNEVQALLDEAQTKLQVRDYEAAAELGRRASAVAHNRSSNSNNSKNRGANPAVKGDSTLKPTTDPANGQEQGRDNSPKDP